MILCPFFFGLHVMLGTKTFQILVKALFLVFTSLSQKRVARLSYFTHVKEAVVELHPTQCLKEGQNWGKLQIIPPNAQHKSTPLAAVGNH